MLVQSFGFRAETFARANDLLQWAELARASCLILDVVMPEMNGFELQRVVRIGYPRLPIIFITAHASPENERCALNSGAIALLRKPVADDLLLRTLRQALELPSRDSSGATPESTS